MNGFNRRNRWINDEVFERFLLILGFLAIATLLIPGLSAAKSAEEIDIGVEGTLKKFGEEVTGGDVFLKKAKGVLVFPSVIKAGFGIGGEYGEGALVVDGKTVQYYNVASASFGLQLGAQSKSIVIVFLKKEALDEFRESKGWKAGVDGSVALVEWGAGGDISTVNIKDPIVGFVFGNKGLMYNLTIEGSKFSRIDRRPESSEPQDE
jgi:lipid-binding SYLF domain-containing protein